MSNSKFIVIAAPSGSGKTTIVNRLLNDKSLSLSFSISATSRAPRNNEVDGINYFFLTKDEFIKKIENKEFVEWEEVYKDNFYGTLTTELENSVNKNLVFDIDVIGGLNIKKKFPKQTITIFIKPPSIDELENRLRNRNLDSNASIKIRIEKAKDEILLADKFDYIVENNILETSYSKVFELVKCFLNG
ncbi:MAG: guanylate kinase [Flavobacteriaceae bacterium]|nr:guanylate kinase [Flavobacteriaceae bacterium]|tara:strand:+ start:222 stop:788 length:567 start_codon:yes stop_codon:yes gene_type:complete